MVERATFFNGFLLQNDVMLDILIVVSINAVSCEID